DQHWAHMLVHGFLHLTGFDHENSTDADLMETLEIRILAGLGFPNPYVSESETGTLETSIPNPHHSNSRENVAPKHGDVSTEASTLTTPTRAV
ncbi:MAG: rRNA maturation RNase YbeY, partial [Gammaproteobacteria bacterium]